MIKITLLYGHPLDPPAFERYYAKTHLPLAAKMNGVARLELTRFGPGPDGGRPAYYRMAELYFASEAQLQTALGSRRYVERDQVVARVRVQDRADPLGGLVDVTVGGVLLATLEHEMFEEVGGAVTSSVPSSMKARR